MKKRFLQFAIALLAMSGTAYAQSNVGINTTMPHSSAALDISDSTKGLLIPRLTMAQRNAIAAPATSLVIYQTDNTPGFYYYNGSTWVTFTGMPGAPGLNGTNGADGQSAYDIAVQQGFMGSDTAWLQSLKGTDGINGTNGADGAPGTNGTNGTNGADGQSAYDIAVQQGFMGSDTAWLQSLKGTDGINGTNGADGAPGTNGTNGQGIPTGGAPGQILVKVDSTDYNTQWITPASSNDWSTTGNNAVADSNFIGSINDKALRFKVNNVQAGYISANNTDYNTSFGYAAKAEGFGSASFGYKAGAIGGNAGFTAIGAGAFENNISFEGVAVGNRAGQNMGGAWNIAIGKDAMKASATPASNTGQLNVAMGYQAMNKVSSGNQNIAIGASALPNMTTANGNIGIGVFALNNMTTGSNNIAIGYNSLGSNSTSNGNNIVIGNNTTVPDNTKTNVTIIGSGIGSSLEITQSDMVYIGNEEVSLTSIAGQLKVNANWPGSNDYKLPATRGTVGQVLTMDTANTTKWTTPATAGGGSGTSPFALNSTGNAVVLANPADYSKRFILGDSTINYSGNAIAKMMYVGDKGAFRVGYVANNNWNYDSIGNFSFAAGVNSKVKGFGAAAFGFDNKVNNGGGFAAGENNTVDGFTSAAIGSNNTVNGYGGIAFGLSNSVTDGQAAVGANNEATGISSSAFGSYNKALGNFSTAIGYVSQTKGIVSTTLGNGLIAKDFGETVVGNMNDTLAITNSTSFADNNDSMRVFTVGGGHTSIRKTNFVVQKNGMVGVNNRIAKSTLDVDGSQATAVQVFAINSSSGAFTTSLNSTQHVVIFTGNNNSGASVILPVASTCKGRIYKLIRNGSPTASSMSISSYIDLSGTVSTSLNVALPIEIISTGTNWIQIGQ
jgi:trimeric autotransporter adhesin